MKNTRRTWKEQCEAASGIRQRFGLDQAVNYLVGEKFLGFLRAVDREPALSPELPKFVAEVRRIFAPEVIVAFFEARGPARSRALGHGRVDDSFEGFAAEGVGPDEVVRGAEEVLLLECARELLVGPLEVDPT